MITRRNLFTSTIAAIAALTVGKAQAEATPMRGPTTMEIVRRDDDGSIVERYGIATEPDDDLTALYHDHFGRHADGPGDSLYMDEKTALVYWGLSQALT